MGKTLSKYQPRIENPKYWRMRKKYESQSVHDCGSAIGSLGAGRKLTYMSGIPSPAFVAPTDCLTIRLYGTNQAKVGKMWRRFLTIVMSLMALKPAFQSRSSAEKMMRK